MRYLKRSSIHISNDTIRNYLHISAVKQAAVFRYKNVYNPLRDRPNRLVNKLSSVTLSGNTPRRHKRSWYLIRFD